MRKATNYGTLRYCIDISGNFYVTTRHVKDPYTAAFTDLFEFIEFVCAMNNKTAGNFAELLQILQRVEQTEVVSIPTEEDVAPKENSTILDNSCYDFHHKQKAAHAWRREMELGKCARLIELASDDVYLESGKLARHSGPVFRKTKKAEKALANHRRALKLFKKSYRTRLSQKDKDFMHNNLLYYSKYQEFVTDIQHGRKLVNQAEIYRNHVTFSSKHGAYFESAYNHPAPVCDDEATENVPQEEKVQFTVVSSQHIGKPSKSIRYCNKPIKAAIFHEGGKKYVDSKASKVSTQFRFIPLVDVSRLHDTRAVSHVISRHF